MVGEATITYTNNTERRLGKKEDLSATDIQQLNQLYDCENFRKGKQNECKDNEYTRRSGQCRLHYYMGSCRSNRYRMR